MLLFHRMGLFCGASGDFKPPDCRRPSLNRQLEYSWQSPWGRLILNNLKLRMPIVYRRLQATRPLAGS